MHHLRVQGPQADWVYQPQGKKVLLLQGRIKHLAKTKNLPQIDLRVAWKFL